MLQKLQKAIREEHLDGWLFYNFRHRDPLADSILGVPHSAMNTRRWFCLVPVDGDRFFNKHIAAEWFVFQTAGYNPTPHQILYEWPK